MLGHIGRCDFIFRVVRCRVYVNIDEINAWDRRDLDDAWRDQHVNVVPK